MMAGKSHDCEIVAVHGPWGDDPPPNARAPASQISYDVVLHTEQGDVPFSGVQPRNRWPDTVDTIPAMPGDEVGISYRGDLIKFWMDEKPVVDEECAP